MKLVGLRVKLIAVGAVAAAAAGMLAACSPEPVDQQPPAGPATTAPPNATPSTAPSAGPKIKDTGTGSAGFDIRYLDEHGQVRRLDVQDFPR